MYRKQIEEIKKDLEKKMVFLVGPRQVGKTWLAKKIAEDFKKTIYLNYDFLDDRKIIKNLGWLLDTELIIFDELHKMPEWKNFLKGIYDTKPEGMRILVTGSARLDVYRHSGDSLAGRFFTHHLLPFSLVELKNTKYENNLDRLINRGGFPEPFLTTDKTDVLKWRNQYIDGLIREDILDFEKIHDFKAIQLVFKILRKNVGSPISYESIARDVEISPLTVKKYIQIFEALFIVFRVTPYSKNIARSLLKAPKIYFFDNGLVDGDESIQLENFVAVSLLKDVLGRKDNLGELKTLKYLRTKDGREVDFCIVDEEKNKPEQVIEVKLGKQNPGNSLKYFAARYDFNFFQLVKNLRQEQQIKNISVRRVDSFLKELFL